MTTATTKVSKPLVLDCHVARLHGGGRLLAIKSPGRRKGTEEITPYLLERVASPLGEAFRLRKLTREGNYLNECYDVLLTTGKDDEAHDRCDCKGCTAHGRCKHTISLRRLMAEGEL